MKILFVILLSSIVVLMSCAGETSTGTETGNTSSSSSWIYLVFLVFPLGLLGFLMYKYIKDPEDIVWTKEDIAEYNKKKAEELGEEYIGQDYTEVEYEEPVKLKRYEVIWGKIKNFRSNRKINKELEEIEARLYKQRMIEGNRLIKLTGVKLNDAPVNKLAIPKNGKKKHIEVIEADDDFDVDIDDIDIEALLDD